MSLRRRLLLTLAPLFILGLIAVDLSTYLSLQSFLVHRVNDQLLGVHVAVEGYLTRGDHRGGGPPGGFDPSAFAVPTNTYGAVVSPSGAIIRETTFPPGNSFSARPDLPSPLHPGTAQNPIYVTVGGSGGVGHYQLYVDTIPEGSDLLVAAIPLDSVNSTLSQLVLLELLTTAGVTMVVLLATWILVRRGLRPLERMGTTARSIAASDLSRRVEPANEMTEVGQLGLAINTMLSQLENAFGERAASEQRLRHFVSDASHELRTPLTSMRGYAELLRRNPDMTEADVSLATRRIEEEASRMGVLVDDLLLLARLDQGRPLERAPVHLGVLVNDACADARASDAARSITARIETPVEVIGDEARLRQVLGNLVRNALVHTPPGMPVEVTLRVERGNALLEVADHGRGIPADNAQRIFERFQRTDPGRSRDQGGSGLGLSIAAAVVEAHGGQIRVQPTPGGGATFQIHLPMPAVPSAPPDAVIAPAPALG
ncbi:MAG: HAMP domain-containing histidine kinase [Candidatus Dormibacteraeota bacterium]|uniref:histidine kinase n=1 Tax=Candidatus Amunia macphersoniae TaxID=3127014 RepID=A0A934N8Z6_9BACT|nr:HAMP domain-containing histidine kinase [Candidatus Dormibacteraeota bacterium]